MSYLGTVRTGIPPLAKLIGAAIFIVSLVVLAWIYWPAPGPDPAIKAIEQQNEALAAENVQLKAQSAELKQAADQATSTGAKLLDQVDKLESDISELRGRRQSIRRAGQIRAQAIDTVPDEQLHDAVLAQLEATEQAQKVQP